jgi:hypothetical protein
MNSPLILKTGAGSMPKNARAASTRSSSTAPNTTTSCRRCGRARCTTGLRTPPIRSATWRSPSTARRRTQASIAASNIRSKAWCDGAGGSCIIQRPRLCHFVERQFADCQPHLELLGADPGIGGRLYRRRHGISTCAGFAHFGDDRTCPGLAELTLGGRSNDTAPDLPATNLSFSRRNGLSYQ